MSADVRFLRVTQDSLVVAIDGQEFAMRSEIIVLPGKVGSLILDDLPVRQIGRRVATSEEAALAIAEAFRHLLANGEVVQLHSEQYPNVVPFDYTAPPVGAADDDKNSGDGGSLGSRVWRTIRSGLGRTRS
jgi:hypothetical protein